MRGTIPTRDAPTETKYGPKVVALAALAVLLFIAGLFITRPLIFVSLPLMAYLGFTVLRLPEPPRGDESLRVQVSRSLERSQITELESCRVRLRVSNRGPRDIAMLQVFDAVPSELEARHARFTIALRRGEERDLFYLVRARSFGVYSLGPIKASIQDAGGIVQSDAVLFDMRSKLIVFPASAGKITRFPIRPRRTKPWPGEVPARQTGTGLDFFGIRELLPGEPPRRINWRASARLSGAAREAGEPPLMVNEYTAELGADALIVLDARGTLGGGEKHDMLASHSARAALSIAERLLRDKNRVGLVTIASRPERVPPATGRRQLIRIALCLAAMEPGGPLAIEGLPYTVHFFYPTVSQVLFISPMADRASLGAAEELSRRRGYDLIVVSPNPLTFAPDALRRTVKTREGRLGWRLAALERRASLKTLEAARALVIDWNVNDPLERLIEVNRRALARHGAQSAARLR